MRPFLLATTLLALAAPAAHADPDRVARAEAVLESLHSGNPAAITATIDATQYRQHNPMFPDGRAALLGALPMLKASGTIWRPVRAFADGDFVVVHSAARFMGADRAAFDVFRFEGERIVEHWDNLQDLHGPTPSGHTMLDGATDVADLDRTDGNKALVRGLISDVFIAGHVDRVPHYISPVSYAQHNPLVADGLDGLQKAAPMLRKLRYQSIEKLLGEGNFVLAMSRVNFDGAATAVYDLFRVEDGKIVEHWDVLAPIPPQAEWKNPNGKF